MSITIIAVGKAKNQFKQEIDYYIKQMPVKVNIIELLDEPTISGLEREGKRILIKIPKNSYIISLAIEGKTYDSVNFSKKIDSLINLEKKQITFIIGGSYGISDEVLNISDELLSFSDFTFPHVLMRLMLVEQVYRAFKIIENHPYHK